MSNVATRAAGGAIASLQSLKSGLANVAATLPRAGGDPILRLLTDGTWVYGAENVEVEEGSQWAVNPFSLMHGYVSWTDYDKNDKRSNEIVGEMMVPFTQPIPARAGLPETGWDWSEQVVFRMRCMSGEDDGTEVEYKTTSVGGIRAVREIIGEIMKQLDVDDTKPVPVVVLETDHYMHKKYGKTYVPVIRVVGWIGMDGPEAEAEEAEAEQPAPQQTRSRSRGAAAAAAEPTETNDAPFDGGKPAKETAAAEPTSSPVMRRRRPR